MTATPRRPARVRRQHPRPGRAGTVARATAVVGVIGLAVTGCAKGDPEPEETPVGALEAFFQEMWGDWDEEKANEQMRRVEELKAECMAREGFEYIPMDTGGGVVIEDPVDDDGDDLQWGTLEFAKKYGYGVTTNPWEDADDPMPEPLPIDDWYDPNQEIIEAMSEAEQAAYWAALYGEPQEEPMEGDEWVPPSWEEMGCSGWAEHEVYGDGLYGGGEDDPFMELQEEMNRLWESMQSDERVVAAEARWADCMADAGYPSYAKVGDAEQDFYTRTDEIRTEVYNGIPPDADEDDWMAAEEEIQARLAELSGEEIELATADYTCRADAKYDKALTEVNLEYQQRFYDEHKSELEQWAQWQSGGAVG